MRVAPSSLEFFQGRGRFFDRKGRSVLARKVRIWDTTLCDGERAPGHQVNFSEKLEMAMQLERLGVDVMEVGHAARSPADFTAVGEISRLIKESAVASLARAIPAEIEVAADSLKEAAEPVLHLYMPTSEARIRNKLHLTPEQALSHSENMVKLARNHTDQVLFSAEDATRSNLDYMVLLLERVISAGATMISITDTLGYTEPGEMTKLVHFLKEKVRGIENCMLSVRCYDDLGMATANSLAAILAGANQVECTVTGIGERAGCASLEEVVVNLRSRQDYYGVETGIKTEEIYPSASLLTGIAGTIIPPDKPVIGSNVFVSNGGKHPYETAEKKGADAVLSPKDLGVPQSKMALGKHSGEAAFLEKLERMGYRFSEEECAHYYEAFQALTQKKKVVTTRDVQALVSHGKQLEKPVKYKLDRFTIQSGNTITTTAAVRIQTNEDILEEIATGDGPIDAALLAVNRICGEDVLLDSFSINAITEGQDALGEAVLRVRRGEHLVSGRGLSTDIVEATILAYIGAVNRLIEVEENDEALLSIEKE